MMNEKHDMERRCGTCRFCRRGPQGGGVQVVDPDAGYACFAEPPVSWPLPNGKTLSLRGRPTRPDDPECAHWQKDEISSQRSAVGGQQSPN